MLTVVVAASSAQLNTAAAQADRVDRVPGQPTSAPPFEQYAGFVNVSNDTVRRDLFYWFVESQTRPQTDPVILWTNGGPGCSGLLGKLTEMGPFRAASNGTNLEYMPYSWNRVASMIFVEQPLFTGYSYSADPADAQTTDELNAARLTTFIDRWLDRFPSLRANPFYIASESYGGHYVPMTTVAVLNHNRAALAAGDEVIQLRGVLVGNPLTDPLENTIGMMDAVWGHGLLPTFAYDEWRQRCPYTASRMAADDGSDALASYSYTDDGDGATPLVSASVPAAAASRAPSGAGMSTTVCRSDGWIYYNRWVGGDSVVNPYALGWPVCTELEKAGGYMERFRLFSLLQARAGGEVRPVPSHVHVPCPCHVLRSSHPSPAAPTNGRTIHRGRDDRASREHRSSAPT